MPAKAPVYTMVIVIHTPATSRQALTICAHYEAKIPRLGLGENFLAVGW